MSSDMKDTERFKDILADYGFELLTLRDKYPDYEKGVKQGEYDAEEQDLLETYSQLIKRETDKAHQEGYKKGYVNAGIEALNG